MSISAWADGGSIDPSFKLGPPALAVNKVAVQTDGKIVIAGSFPKYGATAIANVARLDTNGALDTNFDPGSGLASTILVIPGLGSVTNPPTVTALAVQEEHKVLLGGQFPSVNGLGRSNLVRFNPNGTVDTSFHAEVNNAVSAIALRPGGRLFIGGTFDKIGDAARKNIALLNANGSVDASFNPVWSTPYLGGAIQSITVQADGKILAAGSIGTFAGAVGAVALVRFNADGTLDSSFNAPVLPFLTQSANNVAVLSDGKILLAGLFDKLNGAAHRGIVRLNAEGTIDPSWPAANVGGSGIATVNSLVVQSDGKAIVGGTFTKYNDVNRKGFARINADGTLDTSFNYTAGSTASTTWMALQADGNLVAVGSYTLGNTLESIASVLRLLANEAPPAPPTISTQPTGQTVSSGKLVTLSVVALGTPPLSYQWLQDGKPLAGKTEASLALPNIQSAQAGTYTVTVSNTYGSVTSEPAVVIVNTPPAITSGPAEQTVFAGSTVTFSVTATGTPPLSYQWQFNGADIAGAIQRSLSLENVQLNQAGDYRVTVRNAHGEVVSAPAKLTVNLAPPVITKQPLSQTVVATIKTGLPTCANLNAVNLRGALFTMQVREGAEPFANVGIYQLKLDPTGNMYHLTANGLNPERTGTWSFGVDLGIATVLTVQNYFGNSQIVHWALLPDCTYELYADGLINNQSGLYFVSGGSTSEGTSVTFSVEATGRGPLKYQWHRNGTDIPGATQPTYTIPLVQVSDAGSYTVAVSNDGGTTPSDVAVLTVKSPDAGEALQFSRSANSITLSWPTGYSLQTTARLSPGNWRDVLGASPQTISTASAQAYFRLIKR